jgi:predicted flap endonuclease-1-like 5' DNA nuclease
MKSKRRKKLATIVAPKAILQDNVTRINKIGKKNSKVLHK